MRKASENSRRFLWVGNHPALDFINTQLVLDGVLADLLATPGDYLAWTDAAGISLRLSAAGRRAAGRGLRHVKELRSQMRTAFAQLACGGSVPPAIMTAINGFLSGQARLAELSGGRSRFELRPYWKVHDAAGYAAPLAWAFAEFLATADLKRVRKCKNPECVLFFYDTSKSGTRSWCSLDICGNKMRMAASRQRHKGAE
jgi:predicted RNA-binding Zn ribbon-like protein